MNEITEREPAPDAATSERSFVILGARVVDPAFNRDEPADILIEDGKIAAVEPSITPKAGAGRLNAPGLVVAPGFIDAYAHLRQPGFENAETVASGVRAAVAGGYTTVACAPDTNPPIDTEATAEYVHLLGERAHHAHVLPIGACTKGREGREIAELGVLRRAGVVAYSDGSQPIMDAGVLYRVLSYASMFDLPVFQHAEDTSLATLGGAHSGYTATKLGLPTSPAAAEEGMVARDIVLAKATKAALHFTMISTRGAVAQVRRAKADGVSVTCGVTPHHLTLSDDNVATFDATAFKVSPPLRSADDVAALIEGVEDGTIDVIVTDHLPRTVEAQHVEFDAAPTGVVGLETALGVLMTELVHAGRLSLTALVRALSTNPARLLRQANKGAIQPGFDADLTIFDPDAEWTVDASRFHSKGRNTPYDGRALRGRARVVVVGGRMFDCANVGPA